MPGRQLAAQLAGFSELRLATLATCKGGQMIRQQGQHPFSGVASALIAGGLPAVVAMQFTISVDAASAFTSSFYKRLAAGRGVEESVTEGRLQIAALYPEGFEWACPVLFLRARDGIVLRPVPGPSNSFKSEAARYRKLGLSNLRAGYYQEAVEPLKQSQIKEPDHPITNLALGVALTNGRDLNKLTFPKAKEIHRLFHSCFRDGQHRDAGALALAVLKCDFYARNYVSDPPPPIADLMPTANERVITSEARAVLVRLPVSDDTAQRLMFD